MRRTAAGIITTAAMTLAIGVATTGVANAAGPGGVETCPTGSFCLYYNSSENNWGSFENFTPGSYPNLSGYRFGHYANGSGYNASVYNNVAAIVNNTGQSWKLCTQPNTTTFGTCELLVPGDSGDVVAALKNHDASLWAI